ncbi:unnamed protein product [Peniophora sp. CBMAI 1063]|nr:unnamed protein product [Peniophora sp. CBMAI 1063]
MSSISSAGPYGYQPSINSARESLAMNEWARSGTMPSRSNSLHSRGSSARSQPRSRSTHRRPPLAPSAFSHYPQSSRSSQRTPSYYSDSSVGSSVSQRTARPPLPPSSVYGQVPQEEYSGYPQYPSYEPSIASYQPSLGSGSERQLIQQRPGFIPAHMVAPYGDMPMPAPQMLSHAPSSIGYPASVKSAKKGFMGNIKNPFKRRDDLVMEHNTHIMHWDTPHSAGMAVHVSHKMRGRGPYGNMQASFSMSCVYEG